MDFHDYISPLNGDSTNSSLHCCSYESSERKKKAEYDPKNNPSRQSKHWEFNFNLIICLSAGKEEKRELVTILRRWSVSKSIAEASAWKMNLKSIFIPTKIFTHHTTTEFIDKHFC